MEGFLDIVADRVTERFRKDISDMTFVLPGKRAYQILRKKIADRATEVCWEPEYITLTELVSEYAHIEKADDIVLLAKLFKICRKRLGDLVEDDFDAFESWGKILIEDFSGIDCKMIDAEELFCNVSDFAEIDRRFGAPDLDAETNSVLQEHVNPRDAVYRKKFESIWEHLYDIYKEFRSELLGLGIGYSGLISRKAAEDISRKKEKRFVLVGFNTFTDAEYEFVRALEPEAVYWDEYRFFENEDANIKLNPDGSNLKKIGCPVEESITAPRDIQRKIEVISCPTDTIQCKVVRKRLDAMENIGTETAVVLADDALLPVMLQSVPQKVSDVNVTTGQPISDSPAYIYYHRLRSIILSVDGHSFLREDIEFILNYPCLKPLWDRSKSITALRRKMKENLAPIIDVSEVDDVQFKAFFKAIDDPGRYLLERLTQLSELAGDGELTEAAAKMCSSIEALSTIVKRYDIKLGKNLFVNMLEKSFARGYSPYQTENRSGLQITGILETRCQDFENIFILSADDDTLPKKSHMLSFIPTGIRRHYGLPMSGDFQRMSASYFYHLLMRAKNVYILYNGSSGDNRSGEASRFIQHIRYLKPQNTQISFLTATSPLSSGIAMKTRFLHSDMTATVLAGANFSASWINTYLKCRKKFALAHIYKVHHIDSVSDGFKSSDVGTAVHAVLEHICKKGYSKETANKILADFDTLAMPAIEKYGISEIHSKYPHLCGTGEMERLEKLIVMQTRNVLEYDSSHSGFKTVSTEEECNSLAGFTMKIDRRDIMENGTIRIVDYKSGKKNIMKLRTLKGKNAFEKIERIFKEGSDRKDTDPVLQTLLYALAYKGNKVMPAVYSLPVLSDPSYSPYLDGIEEPIAEEYLDAFARRLEQTVTEISDPNPELEYCEMKNAGPMQSYCRMCDFRLICGY